jgi:precorrin-6B methylase 2
MVVLLAELFGVAVLLVLIYLLGRPIVHGAIYFPTSPRAIREMLKLADPKPGERVVDLGSGDGRILIAFAERGATAVGYEINPLLVRQSQRAIARAGFPANASDTAGGAVVYWESFWRADLSQFDTVIVYGIPYVMRDLQRKLERELRPGTKIISNAFKLPEWTPVASERKIFLYVRPEKFS